MSDRSELTASGSSWDWRGCTKNVTWHRSRKGFSKSPGEVLYLEHCVMDAEETLLGEIAHSNSPRSKLVLGMLYYSDMLDKLQLAYGLFEEVSKVPASHPEGWCAAAALGRMAAQHWNGRGMPDRRVNKSKAGELAKMSAQRGLLYAADELWDWVAQVVLGWMAERDVAPELNLAKEDAPVWYEHAANAGVTIAQFNLGVMYERGIGVEKNVEAAIGWYRRAADEGGDPDACRVLYKLHAGYSRTSLALTLKEAWGYCIKAAHLGDSYCAERARTLLCQHPPGRYMPENIFAMGEGLEWALRLENSELIIQKTTKLIAEQSGHMIWSRKLHPFAPPYVRKVVEILLTLYVCDPKTKVVTFPCAPVWKLSYDLLLELITVVATEVQLVPFPPMEEEKAKKKKGLFS
eukprot:TRINITY_DN1534_c0_g1_i2.p1 TRINITY_DN1534_c0_g1~~TRINITY_DN1534_c0_g1_i2.p1  ORF type:complete len:447 (+),score=156.94 TRINITY_DN1534_c0_g1_i2:129-1343(+)